MTRLFSVRRLGFLGVLLAAVASLGVLSSGSTVSAQATSIDGGSWSCDASGTATAQITLTGIPSAGLGAADISVAFDSTVLKITACDTGDLSGACNPNAPGGPAQAAGFAAPAITEEPVVVATLTFDCIGAGGSSSALTITANEVVDGTEGEPGAISASAQNGSVAVAAEPAAPAETPAAAPPLGTAPGDSSDASTDWIIVLAVGLGVAVLGLSAFGAARRLRRRV